MLKISLTSGLLPLLLLAICTSLIAVNAKRCRERLRICESDCDLKCIVRHKPAEKPHGKCERIRHAMVCNCYYNCVKSRPKPRTGKVCNDGLGLCSARCNNDCCKAKCGRRHNGGQGFCDTNIGISLCQCSYPC